MKAIILNHYNQNNGDRAVLEATLYSLKSRGVKDITVSVYNVEEFKKQTHIDGINLKAIPWGVKYNNKAQKLITRMIFKNFNPQNIKTMSTLLYNKEFIDEVSNADIVLISGGHHLTDIVGDIPFYRIAYEMAYPVAINKKTILLPQSIGPFKNETTNKVDLLKFILDKASFIAYRDENSIKYMEKIKVNNNNKAKLPDMVYTLEPYLSEKTLNDISDKSIGVALYGNYTGSDARSRIERYLDNLQVALDTFIQDGYKINFIPMEIKGVSADDRLLMEYITRKSKYKDKYDILEPSKDDVLEIIKKFSLNKFNIGYKTHSVVFSLVQHKPIIGVAYHQKSIDFMKDYGLEAYAVWDEEATSSNLCRIAKNIEKNEINIIDIEKKNAKLLSDKLYNFIDTKIMM